MSDLKATIQAKYGYAAKTPDDSCCGRGDPITSNLYSGAETAGLPTEAVRASLGCGNPTALLDLKPGQMVLDLGSGGGLDVLLSAKRVGPSGKVYGLDMTDEMLALARANQQTAGAENVEFLKGEIEAIPLPDQAVDVVISNCVINLSQDKARVLREAFRVLRPGGRFAVSDVIVRGSVSSEVRQNMELWIGCIAGALEEQQYRDLLREAGFDAIQIEPWRVYDPKDAHQFLLHAGLSAEIAEREAHDKFVSAFIRATKPAKRRVLILCTGNSARSQMAEGLLRHDAGDRFDVVSAGTHPSRVRPEAIAVMRELGIDISGQRSKSVDEFAAESFDVVLTVCDSARDACPIYPGHATCRHQSFVDPAAVQGTESERLDVFRRVRDEIRIYLAELARASASD